MSQGFSGIQGSTCPIPQCLCFVTVVVVLGESELVYAGNRAASRVACCSGVFTHSSVHLFVFVGQWVFGTGHMPALLTQIALSTSIWGLCVMVYCPGIFYRRELLSCSNYD